MMEALSVVLVCWLVLGVGCALYYLIPDVLVGGFGQIVKYMFYTRNQALQAVFGALVTLGHVVLIVDMLPLLTRFEPDGSHIFLPITLLFTNFAFYQLCCLTDPGRITRRNVDALVGVYEYDGVLYNAGAVCRTCRTVKPARSKHCSFCNRCVHRFDHHCLWTNSCIGAFNLRHFLLFLLSLMAMCVNGVLVSGRCLLLLVTNFRLMDKSYRDEVTGQEHHVTYPLLFQGLFLQFPRVVVLWCSLLVLLMLLVPFIGYHLYLVAVNTTTNERFKRTALDQRQACNGAEDHIRFPASGDDDCERSASNRDGNCGNGAEDHIRFPASGGDDCERSASNRDANCSNGAEDHIRFPASGDDDCERSTSIRDDHRANSLYSEDGPCTELPSSGSDSQLKSPSSGADDVATLSSGRGDINDTKLPSCKTSLYNRGIVRNFCEVFFPQMPRVKVSEPSSLTKTPESRDKTD